MTAYDGPSGTRPPPGPPRLPRAQDAAPNVANLAVWPGVPFPLGATWDGIGTNFSLFSESGESVQLCLFDDAGHETRIPMMEKTAFNFHLYVPGVGPGQRYGYR